MSARFPLLPSAAVLAVALPWLLPDTLSSPVPAHLKEDVDVKRMMEGSLPRQQVGACGVPAAGVSAWVGLVASWLNGRQELVAARRVVNLRPAAPARAPMPALPAPAAGAGQAAGRAGGGHGAIPAGEWASLSASAQRVAGTTRLHGACLTACCGLDPSQRHPHAHPRAACRSALPAPAAGAGQAAGEDGGRPGADQALAHPHPGKGGHGRSHLRLCCRGCRGVHAVPQVLHLILACSRMQPLSSTPAVRTQFLHVQ